MRILLVHNRYIQRGGEDAVFDAEATLLRSRGHEVIQFIKDNREITSGASLKLAANAVWSRQSRMELVQCIEKNAPQIMHVHNTLPVISPSAYFAASENGVPVVQTLHNYRPLCLPGVMSRNGRVCEDCCGSWFYSPGIRHRCYRNSRLASAAVAMTFAWHNFLGTWTNKIDRFIALTQFARRKFIEGGLPADRIVVKPNFVFDGEYDEERESVSDRCGALYVGRLSREKGVHTLISAFKKASSARITLIGDGPLRDVLQENSPSSVSFVGEKTSEEVLHAMDNASYLIMPSETYEGFALVLAEAFSRSLPVIASELGAMAEIVEHGVTGMHFNPNDAADLASKIEWAEAHPKEIRRMGISARREYQSKYTPEANYTQLLSIYEDVIRTHRNLDTRPVDIEGAI